MSSSDPDVLKDYLGSQKGIGSQGGFTIDLELALAKLGSSKLPYRHE